MGINQQYLQQIDELRNRLMEINTENKKLEEIIDQEHLS